MTGGDSNIFTQIGLIVLVGLACKNAILIVEFAKHLEDQDLETKAAVLCCYKRGHRIEIQRGTGTGHSPLMRFTVATYGSEGDTRPFVALCRGLMESGHEVRLFYLQLFAATAWNTPS